MIYEVILTAADGSRDYYFHATLQSARAHIRQVRHLWVKAEIEKLFA